MKPSSSQSPPAKNSWLIVLIIVGSSFATGYLIGFLAKDVAFTDHESALHEAAGVATGKDTRLLDNQEALNPSKAARSSSPLGKNKWAGKRLP